MADSQSKKVVVIATDGSENADHAFSYYMEHLHRPSHYVILLHCPERHSFISGPLGGTADVESIQMMMQEEDAKERDFLEKLGYKMKHAGIGGKVKSVAGKPGEVICNVAAEEGAIFVVAGSRGHGRFRRTIMGSISDYILHHSQVPVFICKHKDSPKHGQSGQHGDQPTET